MKRRGTWLLLAGLVLAIAGCTRQEEVIHRLDDAQDARIGVMTGSTGQAIATARFPRADVQSFDDIMDAVAAMKSGQLDATVTGFPAALQVVKRNADLQLLSEPLDREDTAIAVRKGDTELLAAVNGIIAELQADGTLESMQRRWFKPDLTPYEQPTIVLPTAGEALRVGVSATREPFSFVDQDGRVTGHDGELARLIGARLNRPVQFSDMRFMALIPALQSGKVDLIVTGMTATDERRKSVDFSRPYYANAQVMIVRKPPAGAPPADDRAKLSSVADLDGKRIGVLLGSAQDTYATQTYPRATVLQYQTPSDLVLAVRTEKVDAGFYDAAPLQDVLRQDATLAQLDEPVFSFPVGVGFHKDRAALREQFDGFLADLRRTGVYDDMVRRWVQSGDTTMPAIGGTRSDGTLVVGVSDVGLPFAAVKDNTLIGFDIELADRFAAHLGRTLTLANMEFGSLIASLLSGKTDLIASSIFITAERSRQIDFSEPYYEMTSYAFARKDNLSAYQAAPREIAAMPSFAKDVVDSFYANIILEKRYLLILDGLQTTVVISVLATVLGSVLGALVCFMRMSSRALLSLPARAYIAILRGTPVLVVLMLVFYVVFASVNISPVLVAIIAFAMNFAAYVAEIFRSGILAVDKGQTEAGLAMGFTKGQTFLYIVLPQTVQRILPVYKGEFISLVKMTSIVGYIAVQDLTKASDIIRSRTFDAFFPLVMVAILYFAISWSLMQALNRVERVSDPKWRRRQPRHA
jgi:polar amino acid transport system substrate-binding protein